MQLDQAFQGTIPIKFAETPAQGHLEVYTLDYHFSVSWSNLHIL